MSQSLPAEPNWESFIYGSVFGSKKSYDMDYLPMGWLCVEAQFPQNLDFP